MRRYADALSRLAIPGIVNKGAQRVEKLSRTTSILYMDEESSLTTREIATATQLDVVLGRVLRVVRSGI